MKRCAIVDPILEVKMVMMMVE